MHSFKQIFFFFLLSAIGIKYWGQALQQTKCSLTFVKVTQIDACITVPSNISANVVDITFFCSEKNSCMLTAYGYWCTSGFDCCNTTNLSKFNVLFKKNKKKTCKFHSDCLVNQSMPLTYTPCHRREFRIRDTVSVSHKSWSPRCIWRVLTE